MTARHHLYEDIGRSYSRTRREDPRVAAKVHASLGEARTVVNVGAGTGSYEPPDRVVVAVEPVHVSRDCVDGFGAALWAPARGLHRPRDRRATTGRWIG